MRAMRLVAGTFALALAAASAQAQVTTIYDNDFQTAVNPPGALGTWSTGGGAGAPSILNRAGTLSLGNGGDDFDLSETATLGFSGLAAYSSGTVSFSIRLWDTWDPGAAFGPDIVRFNVDGGPLLLNTSFNFPGAQFNGGANPFTFSFGPGSGALNLNWISATTQTDEGWTIDDVTVSVDFVPLAAVPEPSTYALLAGGLAALGAVARRRRTR